MTLSAFTALLGVWGAVLVMPGPDVVQIIRVAPRSARAGLLCAVGIVCAIGIWLTASLAGVSALIAARPDVLGFLQVFGGAFLVWMGVGSVRTGWAARVTRPALPAAHSTETALSTGEFTAWRAFRLGLATNLSNPKALVFFGAVFAQFIRPEMSVGWTLLLAAVLLGIALVWFCGFSLLVRAGARFLARHSAHIDILAGTVFAVLGLVMVYEGLLVLVG